MMHGRLLSSARSLCRSRCRKFPHLPRKDRLFLVPALPVPIFQTRIKSIQAMGPRLYLTLLQILQCGSQKSRGHLRPR